MNNGSDSFIKIILSILFFPMFFQNTLFNFSWGTGDQFGLMLAKRLFLLLPALAIILACWLSIASFLTIIFRQNRKKFVIALFITWWDLGKSIALFWAGILKFVFSFIAALLGVIKILIFAIWSIIQEILFLPFRLLIYMGQTLVKSQIPWIAVTLTLIWCLIEAVIFTYVTTPLVIDTFSNITGEQLSINFIRIPLFIFLLFIVLGSYSVLSTFAEAFKRKNIHSIIGISVIELVTLTVEILFLYREFVDSLVPWFAQYSENFQLGIFGTLSIAAFVWFGIRSLSWFLFAGHGTPVIMAVIQGKGIQTEKPIEARKTPFLLISTALINKIKEETEWFYNKGDELLGSFILPPLQIIAAAINFCTLLITANHIFELPFKNLETIKDAKFFAVTVAGKGRSQKI
jgi:hypothetical protein